MALLRDFLSNLLDIKNDNSAPDRPVSKPVPPKLQKISKKLKKALIFGFPFYNYILTGKELLDEAKAVERFIRQIAPNCQVRTLYERKTNMFSRLIDSGVTVDKVREALQWLGQGIGPDDSIFFYYSGHGTRRSDAVNIDTFNVANKNDADLTIRDFLLKNINYESDPAYIDPANPITLPPGYTQNETKYKGYIKYPGGPLNKIADEPLRKHYVNVSNSVILTDETAPSEFCIVIPEHVWVDKVTISEYLIRVPIGGNSNTNIIYDPTTNTISDPNSYSFFKHSVENGYSIDDINIDNSMIEEINTDKFKNENETRKIIPIDSLSYDDKMKCGNPKAQWWPMPDSHILMRDDEIYDYIIKDLPEGAKVFICTCACNSGGAFNPAYEWNIIRKTVDGAGNEDTFIYDNGSNFQMGTINKHNVGLQRYSVPGRSVTAADVVIMTPSRSYEETTAPNKNEITVYLYTLMKNLQEQWTDNIARGKKNRLAINLKDLYANLCNAPSDSLPQMSTGRNMGLYGSTTLRDFDANHISINGYDIVIDKESFDNNDDNAIVVNGTTINELDNGGPVQLNDGKKAYYIRHSETNNKTLVIDAVDYGIISTGDRLMLDEPVMFDFF
jgi:hypothetical protein